MSITFLQPVFDWVYGTDSDTAAICSSSLTSLLTSACVTPIFVKLLGILIIFGSCLNKAPLFINILKNESVAGISSSAVYSELIMYSNAAFYSALRGNPFTAYGETALITIQTVGVILLMWKFKKDPEISTRERILATVAFMVYVALVTSLDKDMLYLLPGVNLPCTLFSRGSQIYTYYTSQHTGTQSIITVIMNFTGSAIRVVTTIKEVGMDIPMLSGYAMSLTLNTIQISQFLMYKQNTIRYLKELKSDKKKKDE